MLRLRLVFVVRCNIFNFTIQNVTEEFTEILGKLLGGKQTSKVTAHLEALEELLTEEEYSSFLAEYLGYLTVNVAEFIRSTIIENGLMLLAGSGGEEDGEEDGEDGL